MASRINTIPTAISNILIIFPIDKKLLSADDVELTVVVIWPPDVWFDVIDVLVVSVVLTAIE